MDSETQATLRPLKQDRYGWESPTLVVFSPGMVAYCRMCSVEVVGTFKTKRPGRFGWILDNTGGRAKMALDKWRSGNAPVSGPELLRLRREILDAA